MKRVLLILSGFALTSCTFAFGATTATMFLAAEPVKVHTPSTDAGAIWTSEAVKVDPATQTFQRLPARAVAPQVEVAAAPKQAQPDIDPVETAALQPASSEPVPEQAAPVLSPEHLAWCASRFRSYRAEDNNYRPYSGGKRECVSPFSQKGENAVASSPEPVEADQVDAQGAETVRYAEAAVADPAHIASCFSRYRSYRPEDNSYQPYSGGARKQCE
jgi:hypothetical protein